MRVTWLLADLKTGEVIAELPVSCNGTIERTISTATTLTVDVNTASSKCPKNWYTLIDPRRVMLVPVFDDDQLSVAYIVTEPDAGQPAYHLQLASLEATLDRSYCRTHDFYENEHDEAYVAAQLCADVFAPSFGFEVVFTETGKSADHSYTFEEDRTLKSALDDLAGGEGGPEWTIRLSWATTAAGALRIVKTIQLGPRIGNVTLDTVFDNKALAERRRKTRGYATSVIVTSDGSGDWRPMSAPHVDQAALVAGVPLWEDRHNVPGIEEDADLDRHAADRFERVRAGVQTVEMVLNAEDPACPPLGTAWDAGDTVQLDSDPRPHDPVAVRGPARVIGWRASLDKNVVTQITPVFWADPKEA